MKKEIILIGPIGAGKSTIGELLSQQLGIPQVSMDDLRFQYYKEIGYDEELAKLKRKEGMFNLLEYWKPFEAYAVERLLSEYSQCVIDFGAGHSVYEDQELFNRVQRALSPYPNVVLLMPSPDKKESIEILNERDEFLKNMHPNINEHFICHLSNYILANLIIYTKGKTPEETCNEILQAVAL